MKREAEDCVIGFGKYAGKTLGEISDTDPGYICWLDREGVVGIKKEFLNACEWDERSNDVLFQIMMENAGDR